MTCVGLLLAVASVTASAQQDATTTWKAGLFHVDRVGVLFGGEQ